VHIVNIEYIIGRPITSGGTCRDLACSVVTICSQIDWCADRRLRVKLSNELQDCSVVHAVVVPRLCWAGLGLVAPTDCDIDRRVVVNPSKQLSPFHLC